MSSDCVKTPDVGTEYAEYAKSYTDFPPKVIGFYRRFTIVAFEEPSGI
jgi:hypothetical protein